MPPQPSVENLASILHKCTKERNVAYALHLHTHMHNNGLEAHRWLGSHVVLMLVEVGSMCNSRDAFDRLEYRSECSWNSLIRGYIKCGDSRQALILYQKMQEVHLQPDGYTFVALLKACAELKDLERGCQLHAEIARNGLLQSHVFIGNKLVDMYAKCGSLAKAQEVFGKLPIRDVVSWNALIAGYARHERGEEALNCFEQMQLEGVSPDAVTFVYGLKACGCIGATHKGREIHAEIARKGLLERDLVVGNALVDMYAKCGSLAKAHQVFDKLPVRDVISWTALIAGYAKHERGKEALNCFDQMQFEGVSPNAFTFVCSLKACGSIGATNKGSEIHAAIARKGLLGRNLLVGNTLIDMYAKWGLLAKAQEVFDMLPVRDVISWNALIAGYAKHEYGEEALICFKKMQHEGVSPNAVTFVCSLKACGSTQAIDKGREIHVEITRKGLLERDIVVGNALVDMYAKCGLLAKAQEVFDMLPVRDVVSWTALIAEYAKHECAEALHCFEQMQLEGFSPNAVTLVCILKACGSIGATERGRVLHAEIARKGLLERDLDVGNALVDMYAKCGLLAKAREVFDQLPTRDIFSWNAMMIGYVINERGVEALNCFEEMQLDGVSPNAVTFAYSLKACGSIAATDKGREIHAEIVREGLLERDLAVGNSLVDMYAKCGLLSKAQELFDKLPARDVASWTALIAGYAKHEHAEEALKCFEQMQREGVSPNAVTLVCILKACGSVGVIDKGREIHTEIARKGLLERDLIVGNALVDMYAKCGSLAKAQEVFDKLPVRDVISWNALIAGYVKDEHGEEGLNCFELMQVEGVYPNSVTFICSLKACGIIGATEKGKEIHAEIARKGLLERDHVVGNSLVDMYVKCGSLAKAQEVFEKLPVRDVISWTAMIAGYAKHERGEEALNCYKQMQLEGISPNAVTFVCILKACGSIGALDKGREIHAEIVIKGLLVRDLVVGNALVDMYAKCGSLARAQEVFDKLPVRDTISWNALMAGYANYVCAEEALNCYEQMQLEGVSPNAITFAYGLKACGSTRAANKGGEIHTEIAEKQLLERDHTVGNALVDMYAKCGLLTKAQEVFDMLPFRDTVTWTALIAGYAKHEFGEQALNCFEQMLLEGVSPNYVTLVCSLKACGSLVATDESRETHTNIARNSLLERDLVVGSMLVNMYAKSGSLAKAQEVFDKLPVRDVVLWTALIAGYAKNEHGEEALNCYEQMQLEGVSPDAVTFVYSLQACASIGATGKGREIHAEIARKGLLERDLVVGNALVDMYAKCGLLVKAQEVFDKLPVRDVVSWTALIAGYAQSGESEKVFCIFDRMRREGKKPDLVTFLSVLNACSRTDLVDKGQLYFEAMNKDYGINPSLEHYTCMVDLLGRAGYLDRAVAFIKKIPFHPDVVVWHTVLGACLKWGNVDFGRKTFEHAV